MEKNVILMMSNDRLKHINIKVNIWQNILTKCPDLNDFQGMIFDDFPRYENTI